MPVNRNDPLFKKLASVSEQARDALVSYRTTVADTRTRRGVPPDKIDEHLAKLKQETTDQLTLLYEAVDAASTSLRQKIDAEIHPDLSGPEALLAEMHKIRLDAGLQSLFMAKANEGPSALLQAVDSTVAKYVKSRDWTGIEVAREQAEAVMDTMELDGLQESEQQSMKNAILKRIDDAAAEGYNPKQREAVELGDELHRGVAFVTTSLNYAQYAIEEDNFEGEVLLPTWTGDLLKVGPQEAPARPTTHYDEMIDYRLPVLGTA